MADESRRALEELYVLHERGLYNVAYRYVWSADDARDIVHDAFVRMWNKRDRIDWPHASGLAYRTVLGLAKNRRRAHAIRRMFGGHDAPAVARSDERLLAAELDATVRACIDQLPEKLRSVLVLAMFSELDYAAIGAVLGIPAGTVGSRRNEALARLRELLAARGHEFSRSAS